ncbi:hypothetical protein SAMN05444169_7605 [Bradyrhizobium erythrophlei]|uniref:Uncharacterized protein n=1 Tax=Bradyrhizobium erythrophlei TaxID=1437360 RepID=A0A1M5T7T4_9BRAD|nr:hypothetical protein SAMN05444169_7605 [Bradyrhizobium erythrophlei]
MLAVLITLGVIVGIVALYLAICLPMMKNPAIHD